MTPRINPMPMAQARLQAQVKPQSHETQKQPFNFGEVFQLMATSELYNEETGLRFSKHATHRLQSRNITMDQNQLNRVAEGLEVARTKAVRDALVIVDDLAVIASVPNKAIITIMPHKAGHIFTNINGAILV